MLTSICSSIITIVGDIVLAPIMITVLISRRSLLQSTPPLPAIPDPWRADWVWAAQQRAAIRRTFTGYRTGIIDRKMALDWGAHRPRR